MNTTPEELIGCWETFGHELESIWDELGFDDGIRSTHMNDLKRQMQELLQERIRQEKNVRDQTRRAIQTFASKIVLIYKQLSLSESDAHEFVAKHTAANVKLVQSRQVLSDHLDSIVANREKLVHELVSVLSSLFSLEAELGEETGVVALFSELQKELFTETQANTFKNDPSRIDAERLLDIPLTLERMRQKLVEVRKLTESRAVSLDSLEQQISALCAELGEHRAHYRNAALLQHPPLSQKKIEAFKNIEKELIALRHRREVQIHDLANRLRLLWDQLQVPAEHRADFVQRNEGRSLEVIKACEEELNHLEGMKQRRVKELVMELIVVIRERWDFLSVSTLERRLFEDKYDYNQATFSDETLESHRTLAASLTTMCEQAEPVFKKIDEHQVLLSANAKYEELTKNSDRLRDRKYDLLAEEKLRKQILPLPALTEDLITILTNWKSKHNSQPLLFKGSDYLSFLIEEKEKAERIKAERKRAHSSASSSNLTRQNTQRINTNTHTATKAEAPVSMTPMKPKSHSVSAGKPSAPATTGKLVSAVSRTGASDASHKNGAISKENKDPVKPYKAV